MERERERELETKNKRPVRKDNLLTHPKKWYLLVYV